MSAKHTPTPWGFDVAKTEDGTSYGEDGDLPFIIYNEHGLRWNLAATIGDVPDLPAEANAAFIVRACNAHEELVAAVRGLMATVESGSYDAHGNHENPMDDPAYAAASALISSLARVEGK